MTLAWIALFFSLSTGQAASPTLDQALLERRQGRFDESILTLQALLKADAKNPWAWYELGLTYATDSQYAKAIDAYRLALSYGFSDGQCRCALGLALRETHKPAAALAEARLCLKMLPNYAGAWNLVGNAEIDLGHYAQALDAYENAIALSPGYANAHFNRGLALETLSRDADAEGAFKKALELQPAMQEGWSALGACQLRLRHPKDAVESFRQALRLGPQDQEAEWGLARAYAMLGKRELSRKHAEAHKRLVRAADRRGAGPGARERRKNAALAIEAWDKEARESR